MPQGPLGGPRPRLDAQQVLNILVLDGDYIRSNLQEVVDAAADNFENIKSIDDMGYGEPEEFNFGGMMDIALRTDEVNMGSIMSFIEDVNGGEEDEVLSSGNWLLEARTDGILTNISPLAEATQRVTIDFHNEVPAKLHKEAGEIAYEYMHTSPKGSPQTGPIADGSVEKVIIESDKATIISDYHRLDRSHISSIASNVKRGLQGVHKQMEDTDDAMEVYNAAPFYLDHPEMITIKAE